MPDPVSQIVEQHNQLRRLFKQMPELKGHQSAEDRALAICDLLTIHSLLEEEILYPVVRGFDASMAAEALDAHRAAETLVEKIRARHYADDAGVKTDLAQLERDVEAHARWEEDELLPRVSALGAEEVDRIGSALYERHQELLGEYPNAMATSAETEGFIASPRI